MNNTKSSMIGMKPKDAIKLYFAKLDKSEIYTKENVLPEDGLYIHLYQPNKKHEDQQRRATDLA